MREPEIVFSDEQYGYSIEIVEHEPSEFGEKFYITVMYDGGYCYDGYWGDSDSTLDEAIEEAQIGSQMPGHKRSQPPTNDNGR